MKHIARQTHDFVSDDGKLGVFLEIEDGVAIVTFAIKDVPKMEFSPEDLKQLAEVATAANLFLEAITPEAAG